MAGGLKTKPNPTDDSEPTNPNLWKQVTDLAKGDRKSLDVGNGKTYESPNNGAGYRQWPSPNATGWAVKIYNLAGGQWRGKSGMAERVASRYLSVIQSADGE